MSLKNIKSEKIYKDAYITVFDKFDEEIVNFNSIDELNKNFEDYKDDSYKVSMHEDNCILNVEFDKDLKEIERAKECER